MPPRRSSTSLLLNLQLLVIILPIIALLLLFFAVPSFLSITSHKIRPNTVKKSWDSLNVFLVLFAILCGVFARKNDGESITNEDDNDNNNQNISRVVPSSKAHEDSISNQWFDHNQLSEQNIHSSTAFSISATGMRRLKSSSSYPYLRHEPLWEAGGVDRFRFFDDFDTSKYRSSLSSSSSEYTYHRRQESIFEESNVKEIPVDTFVLRSSPPPRQKSPTPPPPPPPPPPTTNHKQMRAYKTISRKEKAEKESENDSQSSKIKSTPPPPPPPPPPPVGERKRGKSERKKTNATKEIKMVLAALYKQRKRKKKNKTNSSLNDNPLQTPPDPPSFTRSPPSPPPPPPPPPPSVFHSLFTKGSKSKKIHSFSATLPPQPPPPPPKKSSKRKSQAPPPPVPPTTPPEPSRRRNPTVAGRPPLPTRVNNFYEESVNSGGQSPLVPGFKFVVRGDYVKIRSGHRSRYSSPDLDEVYKLSTDTGKVEDGGDGSSGGGGSVFCPSPDVNTKADTFIARLRDEWRLEKINSMKEKRRMGEDP